MEPIFHRSRVALLVAAGVVAAQGVGYAGIITGQILLNNWYTGVSFNGGVGTFTDSIPNEPVSNYTTFINWGDGSVSAGIITALNQAAGQFNVTGAHTYSTASQYTISIDVSDSDGASGVTTGSVTVADALSGQITLGNQVEGISIGNQVVVGSFSDAILNQPASNYSGVINWGDGSLSAGTIASTGQPGQFNVTGSHTYADEGNYTVTIALTDSNGSTRTLVGTVRASDALTLLGSNSFNFIPGTPVNVTLASFNDGAPASDYSALINWGDGSVSTAVIASSGSTFSLGGSHTYTTAGPFIVTGNIVDDGAGGSLPFLVTASTATVPEPGTFAMAGLAGLACLLWRGSCRQRRVTPQSQRESWRH